MTPSPSSPTTISEEPVHDVILEEEADVEEFVFAVEGEQLEEQDAWEEDTVRSVVETASHMESKGKIKGAFTYFKHASHEATHVIFDRPTGSRPTERVTQCCHKTTPVLSQSSTCTRDLKAVALTTLPHLLFQTPSFVFRRSTQFYSIQCTRKLSF